MVSYALTLAFLAEILEGPAAGAVTIIRTTRDADDGLSPKDRADIDAAVQELETDWISIRKKMHP